ncbi:MAG: methylornithine synthase PylB [Desulfobacterales bacterium]|nr:methylornithine synthase PylB [Desulfobacterales bacterium]
MEIIDRLKAGFAVDGAGLKTLLSLRDPQDLETLFTAARQVRDRHFGPRVFFYGFLYFSTFCRNNCRFCQYRNANSHLPRYRKSREDIVTDALDMAASGVHLIDLTMGEDPEIYKGDAGFQNLLDTVKAVREETGLPAMISPGALPEASLKALADSGCEWYACYQETHTLDHYQYLRLNQDFQERMDRKRQARDWGMLIEEGLLTGAGESLDDLANSILEMQALGVDQARIMTFVPQEDTPMSQVPAQDNLQERITIAVMRLALPDRLIPASLDVDGLDGLAGRLDAGANVVTSIVPPAKGLAGVAHHSLDIEESRRTLDHIIPIVRECGLEPGTTDQYKDWVAKRMAAHRP